MTRSKIMQRLMLLLLPLLLFEVVALHLNRRPLQLVAKEIWINKSDARHSRWLVCELKNDRITPVRYWTLDGGGTPAHEIVSPKPVARMNFCTTDHNHWVAPFSSVILRVPVPETLADVRVSIFYWDTSLLSGWLEMVADERRATTREDLSSLPRSE